jgi:septal ring factor EnvC (AmiA/AmiB activator)
MKLTTFILYPIVGGLCINFVFDTPFITALLISVVLTIVWGIYQIVKEHNANKYNNEIETLSNEIETVSNENDTLSNQNQTLSLRINVLESQLKELLEKHHTNTQTIAELKNGEHIKKADWEIERVEVLNKELSAKYEHQVSEYNNLKELSLQKSIEIESLTKHTKDLQKALSECNILIEKAKKANEMRSIKQKQNAEKKKQTTSNNNQIVIETKTP